MYTVYKINADELNENFLASIKVQFQHKDIEIAICETAETEQSETDICWVIQLTVRVC